jgi:hypothetical protein
MIKINVYFSLKKIPTEEIKFLKTYIHPQIFRKTKL